MKKLKDKSPNNKEKDFSKDKSPFPLKLLLATLYWRNLRIEPKEFENLLQIAKEVSCKNLHREINNPYIQKFLIQNKDWIEKGQRELDWLNQNQIQIASLGDPLYPSNFYHLSCPPLLITYRGEACWTQRESLAIVGSRRPHEDTLKWMDWHIPSFFKNHSVNIISGGARGVDQKAHSLCLRYGCPTVCFLPSGIKRIYPACLEPWVEKIIEQKGALISSFSPFADILKMNFYYRNELLVLMSKKVFVAQAGLRSGSIMTSKLALKYGREVITLPSSPVKSFSMGNLQMMYDGAPFVLSAKDLSDLWRD